MAIFISVLVLVLVSLIVAVVCLKVWVDRTPRNWQHPARRTAVRQKASTSLKPTFTVISVTGQHPRLENRPIRLTRSPKPSPGPRGFATVDITDNPTGICKLTGKQVKDCACDRHKTRR
jgi:hypothetical protein